jgi:hypothetical protein
MNQKSLLTKTRLSIAAMVGGFGLATAALAADAINISGTWNTKFDSQVGEQIYTYTFKVEGGKLTGTAKSNLGEATLTGGKVEKDIVTFVEHLDYQGQALDINYEGRIVSADEIKFKRDVAGQGGEEFTARRAK